ncbi:MAG TPA: FAD-binding oxidoreductase, partial [Zeimonas sp.]|nr:FAD-binding oxidoreductase [Zeimonas sp.]
MEANRTAPAEAPPVELESLRAAFGGRLITDPNDLEGFVIDWRRRYFGRALAVAQPDSVQDVANVVRWCARHRVAVVPQGGNTGLSGGATPDESGRSIVLSLARLTKVRAVDPINNSITVEAGCTLAQVHDAAQAAGRLFPLSLPSEGTCTIGGNLATNAGGAQVLRYGNARELCLGIEVVTAAGEIWNGLRGLRKDNTGYDLRDLFVGSEGTLGIITAATLRLFPEPAERATALVALSDLDALLPFFQRAEAHAGGALTAFEFMSGRLLEFVTRHIPGTRRPLEGDASWYVLLEISGAEGRASSLLDDLLAQAAEAGLVSDAAVAASLQQAAELWRLREAASEAQKGEGGSIKHDVSVPVGRIP